MASKNADTRALARQLNNMKNGAGGKLLRRASLSAMLPALREARSRAPVGDPPYEVRSGSGTRLVDPYPVRSYKGLLRTPGFAKRNVARKSYLRRNDDTAVVLLGVRPEAFYAVQFIELGTSKIPKRPWLEPAFRSSIPQIEERLQKRLRALITKAAKKK